MTRLVQGAVQIGSGMCLSARPIRPTWFREAFRMGSVVKKRRKRMAKKKHRKLLRKTRVQRRRLGK
ncbi:30S ribosomal protein bS22 [Micromonosporaceae bacterium Da 78-11]